MAETWIEIAHARAGELSVREDSVIHFQGLPGFPNACRFALAETGSDSALRWLACLDDLELAFVVTDPKLFFPDYAPELPSARLEALGSCDREDFALLSIANLWGEQHSLNLAAPLLVHLATRRAAQIVLDNTRYSIAEPFPGV